MRDKNSKLGKRLITSLLTLVITMLVVVPMFTQSVSAAGGYTYELSGNSATIYDPNGDYVDRITGITCSTSVPGNTNIALTKKEAVEDWQSRNCQTCTPFADYDDNNGIGTVGGLTYHHLVKGGSELFCLNSTKSYHAYRCGDNWTATTFSYSDLGWGEDTFIEIAKILMVGGDYKSVQNSIWATLGQPTDDAGGWTRINTSNLENSQFEKYRVNLQGTVASTLNTEFVMTDVNNNLSSDKFTIGATSDNLSVVKDGNTTRNVIMQPYPLTKTATIIGGDPETTGIKSASISGFAGKIAAAQEFAYLGEFAANVTVKEYEGTQYEVTMPTGSIFFQKKDTFGNNVTSDYCSLTHLCISNTADATNNTFRLLIDNTSEWWGTNADTGTAVTVNGTTYHVFKLEDGTSSFRTDNNGQIAIDNVLVGKYYLQETSVDENVFILNEELVEINVSSGARANSEMKNINLFGDIELQKYDEFGNRGILNTYTNNASGNSFRFKYISTLGKDLFSGKSFRLSEGVVSINSQGYLEIDGESLFTTDSNGYIHVCGKFNSTNNLCVPFGEWEMEEVAVQNEFKLNSEIVDVSVNVGEKTHLDFTNDYREIKLKLFKQDKDNQDMVSGAVYTLFDIDRYNIGNPAKGVGNLYGDQETETTNVISVGSTQNMYDDFTSKQDGQYPDYNYVYELVADGKQAPDKYVSISDNDETITGVSSGKTTVKVSQQVLDLFGTLQDRYYYIGDHTFDPYEDFNFYLDAEGTIPVNIRSKEYTITGIQKTTETIVDKTYTALSKEDYESMNVDDGEGNITNAFADKLEELGLTYEEVDDSIVITLDEAEADNQIAALNQVLTDGGLNLILTKQEETHDEEKEVEVPVASLNDMWDKEGKYVITYTIVSDARQKWTFTRNVSYTDDHDRVCEYNAVMNQYVWGDTKEVCKEIEYENPEVKRAPEEYDYATRTITYDPSIIVQKVEGDEEATYLGEFEIFSVDRNSKPDMDLVEDVDSLYKIGTYTTDENGEVLIDGLMHSRTYLVCEGDLPEHYTYDETENVCFVVKGNYADGVIQKVNTKNNELAEPIIKTTATFEDESKSMTVSADGTTVTITDTVAYKGFKDELMNQDYTLKGWVVSKKTGEKVSDEVTTSFHTDSTKGTVTMTFTFTVNNTTDDYVVFEECCDAEGQLIVEHKDLEDEGQTVHVEGTPKIGTTLVDTEDNDHIIMNKKEVTVKDTVTYSNFVVDREYTMSGELVRKSDQKVLATSEITFTPTTPEGSVELEFTFDASELAGDKVVAFETCLYDGETYAIHKDINDEGQTVEVIRKEKLIATTVSNHDIHISQNNTIVQFVDTVMYENLDTDKVYMMRGYFVDKTTGKAVEIGGKVIEGYKVFKPSQENGKVDVSFNFDAAIDKDNWLDDGTYVVYEELYEVTLKDTEGDLKKENVDKSELIFEHKQIENLDQTFNFTDDYRYYRFKKKEEPKKDDPKPVYHEYKVVKTGVDGR